MADLSITAGSVAQSASAVTEQGTAAAAVTAGQVIAKNASGKFDLADANSATALLRIPYGIALHGSLTDQPLLVQVRGDITIGATVGVGTVYILSATPGGIALGCPGSTDLVSGMYTSIIGIGVSATVLRLDFNVSGVVVP